MVAFLEPSIPVAGPISFLRDLDRRFSSCSPRVKVQCAVIHAVLILGAIFFGTSLASAENHSSNSEHGGTTAMTASQLTKHVGESDGQVYWLGPISGESYSPYCLTTGIHTITYLPAGADAVDLSQQRLTIQTFKNQATFFSGAHLSGAFTPKNIVNALGESVTFNSAQMNSLIVKMKGSPQIVVIHYPSEQSLTSMERDSENLTLIA